MERELISVIIPVYKVEAYLEKCVESVLAQTYENLEVILVDDGSPDNCPAMCDAFAKRNDRVKVIHKENGGQGSARNRGLDIARGAYIGFVDSDDYIAPDMYEKLYAALMEAQADMSICGYRYVDEAGQELPLPNPLPPMPRGVLSADDVFRRIDGPIWDWRFITVVNRLYRRELFDGLRFLERRAYEDEFLAHHVLARCKAVAVMPDEPYSYIQREGSTMHSQRSIQRLEVVELYVERYSFYRARGLNEQAISVRNMAYMELLKVIDSVDVWEHRKAIRPWVGRVLQLQLRRADRRAAWLGWEYLRRLASCRATGKKQGETV